MASTDVQTIPEDLSNLQSTGMKRKTRELITSYLFMTPALLTLLVFVFGPLLFSFLMSLYLNPEEIMLRNAFQYYSNFSNFALESIWEFFIMDFDYEKGIFAIQDLVVLFVIITVIIYMRSFYQKLDNSNTKTSYKLFHISLSIGIIPALVLFSVFYNIIGLLFSLIIGITVLGTIFAISFIKLKKKIQFSRFLLGFTAVINSFLFFGPLTLFIAYFLINNLTFISVNLRLPTFNYRKVLTDYSLDFMRVLFNTVFWTVVCTGLHIVLGMFLAILLNQNFKGKGFFRGIFILPWAIPSFVSTLIWRNFVFDSRRGWLSQRTTQIFNGNSFSFTVSELISLLIAVVVFILAIKFFNEKILSRTTKINPKLKTMINFIAVLILAPIIYYLFIGARLLLGYGGTMGYKIVNIPDITSTFWITDNLYLFENSIRFKMITFSAILINVWLGVPFMMVSFLAALQGIPKDLYEAAEIDGANGFQAFKSITFPLLKPTLFTVSLLGFVWTFNLFNVVYILAENQNGLGPAINYTIFVTFIYDLFQNTQYAQAAALSFIVFIMLTVFSRAYSKFANVDKLFVGESEKQEKPRKRRFHFGKKKKNEMKNTEEVID